ncbi:MAG TPA: precorrin-6y C5,15-methyltransferase (decarboxylating) subunit CbiE [Dissulfurispiraceae bacterium]
MQPENKVYVIGIGYKPLDRKACEVISRADAILASRRLFEVFQEYGEFEAVKEKIKVFNNVDETIGFIRSNYRTSVVALLASGDPMFFGIGRRVIREFGKEAVEVFPELSSIQAAFAKIGEPWDDAFLMSLHGGPNPEKRRRLPYEMKDIPFLLERHGKIAILTDRDNNPPSIAGTLCASPAIHDASLMMYVCERLGHSDEKITRGTPEEISGMSFSDPNVVIAMSAPAAKGHAPEPVFGLTENEIEHSRGLITKDEARAVTIHKLRLPSKGVLWDIGAGSGSVSIEAARLYPGLRIFAVEKSKEQIAHIETNIRRYNVPNLIHKEGTAPGSFEGLPLPDRAFIGGSGGQLGEIIHHLAKNTSAGIIVINAATIETLQDALHHLENAGFSAEVSQISVSRSKAVQGKMHMSALNPVFIITGTRSGN